MKYQLDDPYLFDLKVPCREPDDLDDNANEYAVPFPLATYIGDVLTRSYYHNKGYAVSDDVVVFKTTCPPDSFKLVYERALMEKHYQETGNYCITSNEDSIPMLKEAILGAAGKNGYSVYY